MNIRDLHYFVELAKTRHFGEAAKHCFVSQPTLSMQIKKLEEELQVTLFERDNKRVLLTEAGERLLGRAQKVLADVAEMKEVASSCHDPLAGELRLGVIPTVAPYLLPLVMPVIQAQLPKLKVWLIEDKTHNLTEQLAAGELDAAIMAVPVDKDFLRQELYEELFYLVCAPDYPLPAKAVRLEELANQPVMLLEEGHCLREQAMAICQAAKAKTLADFTATSLETLRLMVQAGIGITLMPALALRDTKNSALKVLPFTNTSPSRHIALFWRASTAKMQCLQAIARLISKEIGKKITAL